MHNQYFEGIMQLRNPNDEVLNFIKKKVNERKGIFISRLERQKDGVDYYFSSRRFLQNLAIKLQKNFGGELKISPRIFSVDRQSSKEVYRINVLYRFPKLKKNDIIEHKGDKLKVLLVNKKILTKDIKTGKKNWINIKDIKSLSLDNPQ